MANTYYKLYIHTFFAVKYRRTLLDKSFRKEAFRLAAYLFQEKGAQSFIVNGVSDHMHCLFAMKPTTNISDLMKHVKANTSRWINKSGYLKYKFEWQTGFTAYSVSPSLVDKTYKYIGNQERHHNEVPFIEEQIALLKAHRVEFDERYLFHKPL